MVDKVTISLGAIRDRESGNVFCAAVLVYKDHHARLNDIFPSNGEYTNMSGGLAHIAARALNRLHRKCIVDLRMACQTKEFLTNLEIASGYRKGSKESIVGRNKDAFESLVRAINTHVEAGQVQVSWKPEDGYCYEVSEMATSFRDTWKENLNIPDIPSADMAAVQESLSHGGHR